MVLATDRYLLNAGDVLDISVWNEEALEKTVMVLPDGTVSFPLAGELIAKGKTVSELEQVLKNNLSEFLADPVVTVVVANVSGNTVHILGKVQTPGSLCYESKFKCDAGIKFSGRPISLCKRK